MFALSPQRSQQPHELPSPTLVHSFDEYTLDLPTGRDHHYTTTNAPGPRRPTHSNLHYWLMARGLESKYDALRSLGAKKISDLALLTTDDHEELGLSDEQVKMIRIEVVG